MVNDKKGKPQKVIASDVDIAKKNVTKRRTVEQLPALLNTEILKKFFVGSGDHLFQPEVSEKIAGFIGNLTSYSDTEHDFYINEPTVERKEHQLAPFMVSTDVDTGDVNDVFVYDDFVDHIRFQGGITNNHDRLFNSESYTWAPPIDIDKLMNYTNYFWFPAGPDVTRITETTNIEAFIGTSDPVIVQGVELTNGQRILFADDIDISFKDRVFVVGGIGTSFALNVDTELFNFLWDDPTVGWDLGPWDGQDPAVSIFIDDPDYIIMERGAKDGNSWSVRNRWYHRDELDASQFTIALERQAVRPIIEFKKNLELYNHGTFGRSPVTVRDDVTTDPDISIIGQQSYTIDGIDIRNGDTILFTNAPALRGLWDQQGWDFESPQNQNTVPLPVTHPQHGQPDFEYSTGSWDPFFNVNYSAPIGDISLSELNGKGVVVTLAGDFIASGFRVGQKIKIVGTGTLVDNSDSNDGEYVIETLTSTIMTFTEPYPNPAPYPSLALNNVSLFKQDVVYRNRIFTVSGIGETGGIRLTIVADGQNTVGEAAGAPANGDQIRVLLGLEHQGLEYYFNDQNDSWILAQTKNTINQELLFQLYDVNAIQLQDPGEYPLSDFEGNKIFGFQINDDPRQAIDSVLGIPLKFNSFGEITFQNHLVTDRSYFNTPKEQIKGYYFHRTLASENEDENYSNDWILKKAETRQAIIEEFVVNNDVERLELQIEPSSIDDVKVFINGTEQTIVRWVIVDGNIIDFFDFFDDDDIVRIEYLSKQNLPENSTNTYTIPQNLKANPNNLEIDYISNSEYFRHFTGLIQNQLGFVGSANGSNNFRGTSKDYSVGTEILQHRAPMLKSMALSSNRDIDYMLAVRYNENEYKRFRNKFLRKITEFNKDGIHNEVQGPSVWIEDALTAINLGKIDSMPFSFTVMGVRDNNEPTYHPSSPSRLGVFGVYNPEKYVDNSFNPSRNMLQMHDGSVIVAFDDFRDDVILEFENRIFEQIPDEYKTENLPDFNYLDFVNSKYRNGDYTLNEFNTLLTPIIQRWAIFNGFDINENTIYSQNNPFTWNYSAQGLPGHWRGIYKFYYDTDRPNTHPWEMFDFTMKPDWWDQRYGLAPYTSTNNKLWNDMRNGIIAEGPRAGTYSEYARFDAPIPTNNSGLLLDPVTLGIAVQPNVIEARAPWKIGDHAPVETIFRKSELWSFAISQISYLMKPVKFIELGWDPKRYEIKYKDGTSSQWVNTDFNDRPMHSELTMHGETQDDGTTYISDGIQQWITDYVLSNGQDVTLKFGNIIRNLDVQLGHKVAGFINSTSARLVADNFGTVPQEDVSTILYRSPSIKEEVYSGVIVERVSDGWKISGYDVLNPIFKIFPEVPSSKQIAIDVSSLRVIEHRDFKTTALDVPYGTILKTQQAVYSFLIGYGRYLESRGWIFDEFDLSQNETNNWRLSGKQFVYWTLGDWANGSLITLSPLAKRVKFTAEQGTVQNIEQIVNGVYSLLDKNGRLIQPENTFVTRNEDNLVVTPDETQAIFCVRLFVAEIEHIIVFNNKTIFDDLIYDPLINLHQPRFKMFANRAGAWRGRLDAPGYIVTSDGLTPNFEKSANDPRRYFEIENVVEREVLQKTARRMFGFESREYMDGLGLSRDTQFEFYQGFIRQKGTRIVLDTLLRSDYNTNSGSLQFLEEWALRSGEFGSTQNSTIIEFLLREDQWRSEPQLVVFNNDSTDNLFDDVIDLDLNDDRWLIKPPNNEKPAFMYRPLNAATRNKNGAYVYRTDIMIAGYPLESEVTHHVNNITDRDTLFDDLRITLDAVDLKDGDTIWVSNIDNYYSINDPDDISDDEPLSKYNNSFMVYRFTDTGLNIDVPLLSSEQNVPTILQTTDDNGDITDHGFNDQQYVMIAGIKNTNSDVNASYNITLPVTIIGMDIIEANLPLQRDEFININGIRVDILCNTIDEIITVINNANIDDVVAYREDNKIILVDVLSNNITLLTGSNATVIGTPGAVYTQNEEIEINNIIIALNGTTVNDAIIDINNAKMISNALTDIEVVNDDGALRIINNNNGEIILAEVGTGTALEDLGLQEGTTQTALARLGFIEGTFADLGSNIFTITNSILTTTADSFDNAIIAVYTESRFKNETERDGAKINNVLGAITWSENEYTFIDNHTMENNIPLWGVQQYINGNWVTAEDDNVLRIQNDRVNVDTFTQAILYNKLTNITDFSINIWDPAKGLFPSQSIKDITYRIEYDPAKYTNGDSSVYQIDPRDAWGDKQVGQVWWDLSSAEYMDYEAGSLRTRRNNWGKLSPTGEIVIYEWVKSPVTPDNWAALVESNKNEPEESFDYKPSGEAFGVDNDNVDAPYVQIVTRNSVTNLDEVNYYFWVKNSTTNPKVVERDFSIFEIARNMTNPTLAGIPWFAPIDVDAIIVSGIETFLTNNDSVFQLTYDVTNNDINRHSEFILSRDGDEKDVPLDRYWNKMRDSLVGFDLHNKPVPDPTLDESRKYGNFIRPRQSWFINRADAITVFIDGINSLLKNQCIVDERPTLFDNLNNASLEPIFYDGTSSTRAECEYDYHVSDNDELNSLSTNNIITVGEQVWVDGVLETNGFWKVYRYDGLITGTNKPNYVEVCSESYKVSDFWNYKDYYLTDDDANSVIDITVDNLVELIALGDVDDDIIVKVIDGNSDGSNIWSLYRRDSSDLFNPWLLIGKQSCTIEFDNSLFNDVSYGNDDVRTGLTGRDQALKEVINALRNDVLTDLEQNKAFYVMIRYVHSEQLLVDWCFKTTYVLAVGFNKSASQDAVLTDDTTQNVIDFVNEAKPYHTKLRDFVTNENFGTDLYVANVTDFDKPVIVEDGDTRVLDPNNPADVTIMLNPDAEQNEWFTNYNKTPELIRSMNTKLLFDRVSCDVSNGWDNLFGWDSGPNENWDITPDILIETAADRIIRSYKPQPQNNQDVINGSIDPLTSISQTKDIRSIISGCNYNGVNVDGRGLVIDINELDTLLDGGTLDNGVLDDNDIIVDGNLFIQPDVEVNHPEELVLTALGESLSVIVNTEEVYYILSGDISASSYTNGQNIVINGISIPLITGVFPYQAVNDINEAIKNAANTSPIKNVKAILVGDYIRILSTNAITLTEGNGTALEDLKLDVVNMSENSTLPGIAFRQFISNESFLNSSNIKAQAKTTLIEDVISGSTIVKLNRISGFADSGKILIGAIGNDGIFRYEEVEYTAINGQNLTGAIINVDHPANSIVVQLDTTVPQLTKIDSYRIANASKTTLANDFKLGDTEIELTNVAGLPKQRSGEQVMSKPGVIWIGSERIEYYRRDGTTLQKIRRGTLGTSSSIPSTYDINGNLISDHNTANIGDIVYNAGTVVIDGTDKQEIPGGYEFETTTDGLQFSNSIQAVFLNESPGSY